MTENIGAVVDKLVERALAGSTGAIRQFLDRTMPVPRGCIGLDLPDLRGPHGIADAQEALIMAVAARQVPARDAEQVMNLIDRFKSTLQTEKNMARYAEIEAEREQRAAAKVAPVQAPAPAAAAEDPATADPDLAAYAKMSWPQLIDAMWDAEEAERKAASVAARIASAEVQVADVGDPAPDAAVRAVETVRAAVASADAKHEINRQIQVGDARRPVPTSDRDPSEQPDRPAAPAEPTYPVMPFENIAPPAGVGMSDAVTNERLRASRARYRDFVHSRAACFP